MPELTKKTSIIKKSLAKNCSGFALLELTIVVLLLTVVLTLGFTFYFFSIAAFDLGERQTDVQQNARMAADFISKELRIAELVVIIDKYEGEVKELDVEDIRDMGIDVEQPEPGYHIYFIFLRDDSIYHQEVDGVDDPVVLLEGISEKVDFNLNFSAAEKNGKKHILKFDVFAEDKETDRTYHLESEVLALNMQDDIKDELLTEGTGTAIVYQVPAPHPAIRSIRLLPQSRAYDKTNRTIDVKVITNQVSDGREVTVEFRLAGENDPENIILSPAPPVINENEASFEIEWTDDLYFGDYLVIVNIESVIFSQHRYFYLLPVIESIEVREDVPGTPRTGVTIQTSGVEEGTDVLIADDLEPEGDELFIALVEKIGEDEYELIEVGFHGSSPENPKVDSSGEAFVILDIRDAIEGLTDYENRDFYVAAKIGRIDWVLDRYLSNNPYLSALEVRDPGGNLIEIDPAFEIEDYNYEATVDVEYEATVDAGLGSVDVIATLDDENASLEINGDPDATSGESYNINLADDGADTIITVKVTSEDETEIREYNITVIQEDPEDPEAPFLSNLEVRDPDLSPLILIPSFDKDVYDYEVSVEADLESVRVTATFDDGSVSINGDPATSGAPVDIGFSGVAKEVLVIISADGGVTTREYTITVKPE